MTEIEIAIQTLKKLRDDGYEDNGYGNKTDEFAETLQAIDTAIEALQERKTGKWFLDKALNYRCSVCNRITTDISVTKPLFCQWCGAKMKVGE